MGAGHDFGHLRDRIRGIVGTYCDNGTHRQEMLRVLSRPGFALDEESDCQAGALTVGAYEAVVGEVDDVATTAAAAVQLQMEAAYLFDDVADDEVDPSSGCTPAESLALAISLLTCGAGAASEAADLPQRGARTTTLSAFHRDCTNAAGGQYLDAALQRREGVSTKDALSMTALKCGSLGRFAAAFGAGVAQAEASVIELLGEFGYNFLTYAQLVDDIRDACPVDAPRQDLLYHKNTLPLAHFYAFLADRPWITGEADPHQSILGARSEDVRRLYLESGAELFSAVIAETFLGRARRVLDGVRHHTKGAHILQQMVESLEIAAEELAGARRSRSAP